MSGRAQLALWCAGGALALWCAGRLWPALWPLLWPFLAGGLAALILEPAVAWLTARGLGRTPATVLALAAGVLCGSLPLAWFGWLAWKELIRLRDRLPALYAAATAAAAEMGRRAGAASSRLPPWFRLFLENELRHGYADGAPLLQRVLAALQHGAAVLPDALFASFVAFAAAYFALRDREVLAAWLERRLAPQAALALRHAARAVRASVWGMLRAQVLLAGVTFGVSLIGLWLIGAPYAVLAALVAAVLDALPVVGPTALFVPWMLGCALAGLGGAVAGLAAVMLAVAVARWVLTPHLLGGQVGLHPFVALAAMFVGAHLAGLAGLLLGPLCVSAVRAIADAPPPSAGPPRGGIGIAPPQGPREGHVC